MVSSLFSGRLKNRKLFSGASVIVGLLLHSVLSNAQDITITLPADTVALQQGVPKRSHLTGATVTVTEEQFNQGLVVSVEQLVNGRVAGLQVIGDGAPGAGNMLTLLRTATLAGDTRPLIVLDGVMLENDTFTGLTSPLALLNPDDVASVTVLKDAVATSRYGSRGANGVLLITTKRSTTAKKLQVTFRSQVALATLARKTNILSAEEFRQVVNERGTQAQKSSLGTASIDWQEEIYNNAVSHDQNLSLGGTLGFLPYRLSLGYLDLEGLLTNTNFTRKSAALTLNPSLFKDHLKLNISMKKVGSASRYARTEAITNALLYNPTQPVYLPGGEYYEWRNASGNIIRDNPVRLLEQQENRNQGDRSFYSLQADYSFHFLPALHAHVNLGHDAYTGEGREDTNLQAFQYLYEFGNTKRNRYLEPYFTYSGTIEKLQSQVKVTAGALFQNVYNEIYLTTTNKDKGEVAAKNRSEASFPSHALFANLTYGFKQRYFLEAHVRNDGTSVLAEPNKNFTSATVGVTWQLAEEFFLRNQELFSLLNLRAGYGVQGSLPYLPSSRPTSSASGSSVYVSPNLQREEIRSIDLALDYGLWGNRLTGSIAYFNRKTSQLLYYSLLPSGYLLSNGGSLVSKGWETALQYDVHKSEKLNWLIGFHGTYAENELTELPFDRVFSPSFTINEQGGPVNPFYAHKQIYKDGMPAEGQYEDINKDGVLNGKDQRPYKSGRPSFLAGINSRVNYAKWHFDFLVRGEAGNYVYNGWAADNGYYWSANAASPWNLSSNVLETNFNTSQASSDYYIQNASYLRMEYISLGYDFGSVLQNKAAVSLAATVQNAFVLTGYKGQEPEVVTGVDRAQYPRPRVFSLRMHVTL